MHERVTRAKVRFERSSAGDVWKRLSAVDFMNQAFILAALLMICLIPFLMVVAALKGADYVDNLSFHLGLSDAAADDVRTLFGPSAETIAASTIGSLLWLALVACGVASVIQGLYQQLFGVEREGARGVWRLPVWIAVAVCTASGVVAVDGWLEESSGRRALAVIVSLPLDLAFWWWSLHFLLAGRRTWRYLLPAAVATALFWAGLRVFSVIAVSSAVTANEDKYGPIGVVFILMTWLIAMGVVILLGAAVGAAWRERRPGVQHTARQR